jgi:hypothetical protein
MSKQDNRQRTNCSACGQRYQAKGVGILTHELRFGHGAWLWHFRWLCYPCRAAHLDVILDDGKRDRRRLPDNGSQQLVAQAEEAR